MTPTLKQQTILRRLGVAQANYEAAGRAFDTAFRAAYRHGCSGVSIALELDVTQQAVSQRIKSLADNVPPGRSGLR